MTKLTEQFVEIYKTYHSYGVKDACLVSELLDAVRERDKEVVGEDEYPTNVEHPHFQRLTEDSNMQNDLRDEIRQKQEESL